MTKNVLLVGCSNLVDYTDVWNDVVFGGKANIKNLSFIGVGNHFIYGNLVDFVEENDLDYVYVQFSGLTRYDLPIHDNYDFFKEYYLPKTYKRRWLCSGGNTGQWLKEEKVTEFFMPLYFNDDTVDHVIKQSLITVSGAVNYLENKGVSFNWNFYYDICNPAHEFIEKHDGKTELFPSYLSKKNWIDNDPHTFCSANNALQEDHMHFVKDGYTQWLQKNLKNLNHE